ncbi:MAG: hypothetical protein C5S47_07770 [Candidatus Methanogasteraceae archaeon]|nr:MAG: hypothetical protein C5S47_07770 [ANME-2 cluster archaeon]
MAVALKCVVIAVANIIPLRLRAFALNYKMITQRRKGAETERLNKPLDRLSCCICLGLVCSWSNWQLQKSQFMPVVSMAKYVRLLQSKELCAAKTFNG